MLSFWGSTQMYMIIIWILVAIIAVVLETESAELVSIWFSLGAIGGLLAAILEANVIVQMAVFAGVSFILVLATRPLVAKLQKNTEVRTNADRLIGKVGEVTREITPFSKGESYCRFSDVDGYFSQQPIFCRRR